MGCCASKPKTDENAFNDGNQKQREAKQSKSETNPSNQSKMKKNKTKESNFSISSNDPDVLKSPLHRKEVEIRQSFTDSGGNEETRKSETKPKKSKKKHTDEEEKSDLVSLNYTPPIQTDNKSNPLDNKTKKKPRKSLTTEEIPVTEVKAPFEVQPTVAETEIKPKAKVRRKSEVKPDSGAKSDTENKSDTEGKTVTKIRRKSEAKPDSGVKSDTENKSDTEGKPKAKVRRKSELKLDPGAKSDTENKSDTEGKTVTKIRRKSEIKPDSGVKSDTENKSDTNGKPKAKVRRKSELKLDPGAKSDNENKSDTEGKTVTKVRRKSEVKPDNEKTKDSFAPKEEAIKAKPARNPIIIDADKTITMEEVPKKIEKEKEPVTTVKVVSKEDEPKPKATRKPSVPKVETPINYDAVVHKAPKEEAAKVKSTRKPSATNEDKNVKEATETVPIEVKPKEKATTSVNCEEEEIKPKATQNTNAPKFETPAVTSITTEASKDKPVVKPSIPEENFVVKEELVKPTKNEVISVKSEEKPKQEISKIITHDIIKENKPIDVPIDVEKNENKEEDLKPNLLASRRLPVTPKANEIKEKTDDKEDIIKTVDPLTSRKLPVTPKAKTDITKEETITVKEENNSPVKQDPTAIETNTTLKSTPLVAKDMDNSFSTPVKDTIISSSPLVQKTPISASSDQTTTTKTDSPGDEQGSMKFFNKNLIKPEKKKSSEELEHEKNKLKHFQNLGKATFVTTGDNSKNDKFAGPLKNNKRGGRGFAARRASSDKAIERPTSQSFFIERKFDNDGDLAGAIENDQELNKRQSVSKRQSKRQSIHHESPI